MGILRVLERNVRSVVGGYSVQCMSLRSVCCVVQGFCILTVVLSITERGLLKSPTNTVDLFFFQVLASSILKLCY